MRPDIYFRVYDWMLKKLKLKGAQLLIVAYLFECKHCGHKPKHLDEIANAIGYTRRQLYNSLRALKKKNYVTLIKKGKGGAVKHYYSFNEDVVFELVFPVKK